MLLQLSPHIPKAVGQLWIVCASYITQDWSSDMLSHSAISNTLQSRFHLHLSTTVVIWKNEVKFIWQDLYSINPSWVAWVILLAFNSLSIESYIGSSVILPRRDKESVANSPLVTLTSSWQHFPVHKLCLKPVSQVNFSEILGCNLSGPFHLKIFISVV